MKQRISVIMPVYNGAATLRAALDSALAQTLTPLEIVIVNTNSTDATASLIAAYAKQYSLVVSVAEPLRSRGAARAAGVAAARGEIIAMLDADCIAPPNWLELLTRPIREGNEQVVQGTWHDTVHNYWATHTQRADERFLARVKSGDYIHHLSTRNCTLATSLAKRVLFDPHLVAAEDLDVYVRLRTQTSIRFLDTCSVGVAHNATLRSVVTTSFWRGVWWTRVYKKHRHTPEAKRLPHFESMRVRNMIVGIPGLLLYFVRRPFAEALYTVIAEIPWRLGVLWGYLRGGSFSEERK